MSKPTMDDIENAILSADDAVVSVPEVVRMFDEDVSDTHVRDEMKLLRRSGALESKDVGARATAWWHVDRVRGPIGAEQPTVDETERTETAPAPVEQDDVNDGLQEVAMDPVGALDLPGQGIRLEEREEAMHAVLNLIGEMGEAEPKDIKTLFEDHSAGFETERSWWKNCVAPALKDLQEAGVVDMIDPSSGTRRLAEGHR